VRDTPAELAKLIDRMRGELHAGAGSFERGKKAFDNHCSKCHKFEGRGHDVGPNLDGAARDIEYLLVNVLDPNRVIGAPYFMRQVVLKSGRIESGLLAEEDEQSVTLKGENDVKKVVLRKDIEEVQVSPKSVMPEGLAGTMTAQDFRDLVRYAMVNPFLTEIAEAGPVDRGAVSGLDEKPAWKRRSVGVSGRITLPELKKSQMLAISAEVTAPGAMPTRLLLGSDAGLQVFLNGKEVHRGEPTGKAAEPDQVAVNVELKEGRNVLLIKATEARKGSAVYARFLDPQRKLRHPEPGK
jgi:putative heme-binding domain-containing protein